MKSIPDDKLGPYMDQLHTNRHPIPLISALLLHAGLRISEARNLLWDQLVYDNRPRWAIELDRNATKNHLARSVPVSRHLHPYIASAWAHYALDRHANLSDLISTPAPGRKPLSVRTLQRAITKAALDIGLTKVSAHTLRHTCATRLLRQTDLRAVQELLGHRKITTTAIYVHPEQSEIRIALDSCPPA